MLTAEMPTTAIISSTRERPAAARKRLHAVSLTVLTEFPVLVPFPPELHPTPRLTAVSHLHYPPIKEQLRVFFFLPVFNLVVCHSPLFFQLVVSSFHLCV